MKKAFNRLRERETNALPTIPHRHSVQVALRCSGLGPQESRFTLTDASDFHVQFYTHVPHAPNLLRFHPQIPPTLSSSPDSPLAHASSIVWTSCRQRKRTKWLEIVSSPESAGPCIFDSSVTYSRQRMRPRCLGKPLPLFPLLSDMARRSSEKGLPSTAFNCSTARTSSVLRLSNAPANDASSRNWYSLLDVETHLSRLLSHVGRCAAWTRKRRIANHLCWPQSTHLLGMEARSDL
ncbi:hypothetical protein C8R44DRAFT_816550 [Mycena epipterygia]|nr:hypothetical protein C8R44DRAFT_816550 [Mycena epipterygia]